MTPFDQLPGDPQDLPGTKQLVTLLGGRLVLFKPFWPTDSTLPLPDPDAWSAVVTAASKTAVKARRAIAISAPSEFSNFMQAWANATRAAAALQATAPEEFGAWQASVADADEADERLKAIADFDYYDQARPPRKKRLERYRKAEVAAEDAHLSRSIRWRKLKNATSPDKFNAWLEARQSFDESYKTLESGAGSKCLHAWEAAEVSQGTLVAFPSATPASLGAWLETWEAVRCTNDYARQAAEAENKGIAANQRTGNPLADEAWRLTEQLARSTLDCFNDAAPAGLRSYQQEAIEDEI